MLLTVYAISLINMIWGIANLMVARVRTYEETGDMYADNLKEEARVLKYRLQGRYVWKTYFPIDSKDGLPKGALVLEDEGTRGLVPTTVFDPKNKKHFVKFPPYVATPETKRLTFSQRRKLMRESIDYDLEQDCPTTDKVR